MADRESSSGSDFVSSGSDFVEQTARKAARLLAKTAADQAKPHSYNAYVAAASKTLLAERGDEIRALAATGTDAEHIAQQLQTAPSDAVTGAFQRAFPNAKSAPSDNANHYLAAEKNTRRRHEDDAQWTPPDDETRARIGAIIDATRAELRADSGVNDIAKQRAS